MISRSQTTKIQAPTQFRQALIDQSQYIDPNPNLLDEIRKCIRQKMQDFKAEVRQEIRAELQEINQSIDKLTGEISAVKRRVGSLEYRDDRLAEELEDIRKVRELDLDDRAVWEQKLREKCIKIRGLPEQKSENLMETLVPKLANFIKEKEELFYQEVDGVF